MLEAWRRVETIDVVLVGLFLLVTLRLAIPTFLAFQEQKEAERLMQQSQSLFFSAHPPILEQSFTQKTSRGLFELPGVVSVQFASAASDDGTIKAEILSVDGRDYAFLWKMKE